MSKEKTRFSFDLDYAPRFRGRGHLVPVRDSGSVHLLAAHRLAAGEAHERIGQSVFWQERTDRGRRKPKAPTLEELDHAGDFRAAGIHASLVWRGARCRFSAFQRETR